MNINITSRKFKAKESLKDFIKSELKRLEKFNDNIIEADVVLSFMHLKDSIKLAEIVLRLPGKSLVATEESDDFQKAFAAAVNKLERQLKKLKTKRLDKVR